MRRVVLSCTGWSPDTSCTIVASTVRDVKGVGISFVTSYKFGKKVGAESVTPDPSTSTVEDDDCVITGEASESPLKFYPVTIDWQQKACQQLGLQYHTLTRIRPGGPNVPLTRPVICIV